MVYVVLEKREIATILSSLRTLQGKTISGSEAPISLPLWLECEMLIATNDGEFEPLTFGEINWLCDLLHAHSNQVTAGPEIRAMIEEFEEEEA